MKPLKHLFYIFIVYFSISFWACNREGARNVVLPSAVYITYADAKGNNNYILSDIKWDNYSPNKYVLNIDLQNLPIKLNYNKLENAYLMKKVNGTTFSKIKLDAKNFDIEFKSDQLTVFYNNNDNNIDEQLAAFDVISFEVSP
ncbi:hypothetical protein [Solitalea canadensis]|uniref:Uncharacterized protein n=1 Tax=Solitalea canadensis (strain ATCC 29591 / DSM 3403 / JCM 21819 / LMG 8368 / NBRC 15130 / NCIMB 12057 / USAM 9D) TaxID=929556 RepID=H8KPP2_SOLCM|nr:hypothetical protein [Solitalea canadensis]AFD05940.1 hypothetical protein Solca_0823 [Solitalea canadensis DSM 3403]